MVLRNTIARGPVVCAWSDGRSSTSAAAATPAPARSWRRLTPGRSLEVGIARSVDHRYFIGKRQMPGARLQQVARAECSRLQAEPTWSAGLFANIPRVLLANSAGSHHASI